MYAPKIMIKSMNKTSTIADPVDDVQLVIIFPSFITFIVFYYKVINM